MAILIEEQFEVDAPIERVWDYLSDPPRVAPCLPGAQLTEVVDERTYKGQVRVKVGPIVAQYQGTVNVEHVDAQTYTVTMVAQGKQTGATGRAEGRMTYTLQARNGQGTRVLVNAEVNITGRIAQLGSSMIQSVSKQLFNQFIECLQGQIGEDQVPAVEGAGEAGPSTNEPLRTPSADEDLLSGGAVRGEPSVGRTASGEGRRLPSSPPGASGQPVNALALGGKVLLRALLAGLAQLLRFLLGVVERAERAL